MLTSRVKNFAKNCIMYVIPLCIRKRLALLIDRQGYVSAARKYWWTQELVKDLREKDANEYHKFLWQNHLAYAETYEIASRYGYENIEESRKLLFNDLEKTFTDIGIERKTDVHSVCEVGCSLGYLLRYMEEEFFPSARTLIGLDIDERAIAEGSRYLINIKSKIELKLGDMESLGRTLDGAAFDAIFCLGVLMYLRENQAKNVVREMMGHSKQLLVMSGVANPDFDNKYLKESAKRTRDGTFIHNFDEMVKSAGGEIVFRRWEGTRMLNDNSIYFVFARPRAEQ